MKTFLMSLSAFGVGISVAVAQTPGGSMNSSSRSAYSDSSRCNTVELKPGESLPLATPIANLPNGRGRKAAEVPRVAPIPSLADGSKVVTDANGGCTIYRHKADR
jgi:hypothetical protein